MQQLETNIEQTIQHAIRQCMQDKDFFKTQLMKAIEDEEVRRATLSYIEDHEVEEARKLMEEQLGFKFMRPCGYQVLLKLYIRSEVAAQILDENGEQKRDENGNLIQIIRPDSIRQEDRLQAVVGLVLAMGPEAYKGLKFRGIYCRPGDWVLTANYEGSRVGFKDMPVVLVTDDRILSVVEDPEDITPIMHANKY